MILRAVGYDKNGEFSGADWVLHVAQTAQQLGVLDNVAKTTDLNAPASRELVAELLFRGIQASTVTYTPAFGYVTDKVLKLDESTLGYKNFKLVGKADSDKWGRPGTLWTYNVGDKKTTVIDKPDVSYDTTHAGWVSKIIATSNRLYLVKTEDGLLSAEPVAYNTNDTQVTLDDDYSDAYTGKTPYVNVVAGETGSKFDNNLLSMAAGQNFTTNESTKFVVDGKTAALPYSLTDYNVIIVWDRAKSTALQVYAYSKDTTKTNTDIVYSVVARDNQVITATVNNGTLTIDQAKLVSSTNGAANVDAAFTTATATVKFYDLAATRQAAVTPTVNGGGTACVISISVPTTLTPANYKVVVTLGNVKVGSDVVATSPSVFENVIGF